MHVRKHQRDLTHQDWDAFIAAVDAMHGTQVPSPRYRRFVRVHVDAMTHRGMSWGVHSMMDERGRNFLAWHRWYLHRFERRLQETDPNVTLPYWDWLAHPEPPRPISKPQLLERWDVERDFQPDFLPTQGELDAAMERRRFAPFQFRLEMIHGAVHVAVGGTMAGASSPADPLFWLHHANIDRLWSLWQKDNRGARALPENVDEVLEPPRLFGATVGETLKTRDLGYRYA